MLQIWQNWPQDLYELFTSGSGSNSQQKQAENSLNCFSCDQPGHISPICTNKFRDDKTDSKTKNGKKQAKIMKLVMYLSQKKKV